MNQNPLVSVICSCYNHEKYVIESIQSVLNQSYKNIQIIVVDDFSTDDSVNVIETFLQNFPEITFIKNNSNLGVTKSVNNAMNFAKGAFYIDLSADDILMTNCIETQQKTFENSAFKNVAIVFGNAELISENGNHDSFYFNQSKSIKSGDIYCEILSLKTVICSVSAMYKKSVFKLIGGYDENLFYEDLDFWIRVSRNFEIEFIDKVIVKKRILSDSLHANFFVKNKKISQSNYIILKKAYKINSSKEEFKTLKDRIFFEVKTSFKYYEFSLFFKNLLLWLKTIYKSKFY